MARILGIPAFLTEQSVEDDADLDRQIRRAKADSAASQVENEAHVLELQKRAINAMHDLWEDRLIRRTIHSKNEKGEVIIDLPPYKDIVGLLKLQDWEREIIEDIAVRAGSKYVFSGLLHITL
jgi:TATA-binding protein-associated factor